MTAPMNPSEVAREALRQLALRRTPPTPDNYRDLYHEIAGTAASEAFPGKPLKALASALPRETPEQMRFGRHLDGAVAEQSWDAIKAALNDLLGKAGAEPPPWAMLIRDLLLQLEARQAGITQAKKREALEHVLSASGTPDVLFGRLQSLLKNWAQSAAEGSPTVGIETAAEAAAGDETAAAVTELRELIGQLLENAIAGLLSDNRELADEAAGLARDVRTATDAAQLSSFAGRLKKFSYRLQFVAEDQTELKGALLHLLQLIVQNIDELVVDDQWLHGQIAMVTDLVNQPLNLRRLDDVERRLKDLIFKQSNLKKSLNEARERLKAMLATFVDRLASFNVTTGDYHDKIGRCAEKIGKARDIGELSDVLDEVMRETRGIQVSAQQSHKELTDMRRRVEESEKEIDRLQNELAQASEMVRVDALTGALNRKGMDEALEKEVARVHRRQSTLCLALLDIDNFKKLNDSLGHQAGDQALIHLANVTRDTLRPQDTLARYGGEEFVVLLPDTSLDDAIKAMTRVQRELTRKFFLHNNEKVLITFSCGVAEQGASESGADAVRRADQAMYLAKRAGKNRVVAA